MRPVDCILLTSVNKLGDAVAFLPTATAIRRLFPRARITMLTGDTAIEAVRLTRTVDRFIALPPDRRLGLLFLASRVRSERFDLAVTASGDSSYVAAMLFLAGVPQRVGFEDSRLRFLLTRRLAAPQAEPEAERNFRLAQALGAEGGLPRPPFHTTEWLRGRAEARWKALDLDAKLPLLLVHAGSATVRRWPPEHFAQLCSRLLGERRAQPVVLEGPSEPGLGAEIARRSERPLPVLKDLEGIDLLAAMMQDCALFLGHSSGPLHLAFLAGTPTVSLWGETDPALWGPAWEQERHTLIRSPRPCAPCERWSDERHRIQRGRPEPSCEHCMEAILPETVYEAVVEQLRKSAA